MDREARKLLERAVIGNIMRSMCSRECYSASLGNLIAGLLIFLGAFLVGVGAVRAIVSIFLPDVDVSRIQRIVGPIEVRSHTPMQDLEPLEIRYEGYSQHLSIGEQYRLTNLGFEPIFFEPRKDGRIMVHISDIGGFINEDLPLDVKVQELMPGDSVQGTVWIPQNAEYYDLSIDYAVGDHHVHRTSSSLTESYYFQSR